MPRRVGWQGAWHLSRALWVNYCLPIGLLPFAFNHVEVASLQWNGRPVLTTSPACHRVIVRLMCRYCSLVVTRWPTIYWLNTPQIFCKDTKRVWYINLTHIGLTLFMACLSCNYLFIRRFCIVRALSVLTWFKCPLLIELLVKHRFSLLFEACGKGHNHLLHTLNFV